MKLLRDIRAAFGLLTVVPVDTTDSSPQAGGDPAAMFPLVGLTLGLDAWLVVVGALLLENALVDSAIHTSYVLRAPYMLATLVIIAWGLGTRFLHWDGLGDVGDAWWGGYSTERRLEIMADSSLGAFGTTAIVMVFGLYVTAFGAAIGSIDSPLAAWFLVAIPLLGRAAATCAAWLGTSARSDGLGHSVMGRPSVSAAFVTVLIVTVGLAPVVIYLGIPGVLWCGTMLVIAAGVPHVISLRMGGVTGDVMGASVLLTEVLGMMMWVFVGWF